MVWNIMKHIKEMREKGNRIILGEFCIRVGHSTEMK